MIKQTVCFVVLAQFLVFGILDRIQKAMEKREYDKVLELTVKGLGKEPQNPGLNYYQAKLFFDQAFNRYNIDTALLAIERAQKNFSNASQKLKEEVGKRGITAEEINLLHEQIRNRFFQNTLNNFSISMATDFQRKFPNSIYEDILVYKVDSMEYRLARTSNTESELIKFIADHPTSAFKPKADSILDGMRFSDLQRSGSLKDYYAFHSRYPLTRHKSKVENYILQVSTASHLREKYEDFIKLASTPTLKKRAADVLYYLFRKQEYLFHPDRDSLQKAISLSGTGLYPVIQNGKFGFYNRQGQLRINHQYQEISENYKCKLTPDDWIFAKNEECGFILTKEGEVVLKNVDDYRSLSEDTGLIKQNDQWFLHHKSGFRILNQAVEDARVISNKWIKVKRANKWGLVSYMGLQIAEIIYDDISKMESFWIFRKNDLLAVYTEELILKEIEKRGLSLEFKFDDIELVDKNTLIGFREDSECLLDSTLNFLIAWGKYEIYPEESGWYLKSDHGYQLYNASEAKVMDGYYPYLESNDGWMALKAETDWMLFPRRNGLLPSRSYDSIKLVNTYAVALLKANRKNILFSSGKEIPFTDERISTFQNRPEFISLSDGVTITIFDKDGKAVVSGKFENTFFLNDTLIRVQIRGKQGLMNINGDWILNPVFDTIDEKNGLVLTLINGKIGCYDLKINKLIATEYETRIERMHNYYLAKKDGKFGAVDQVKKVIISFSYDEIRLWNDTSYLVGKEGKFFIINADEEPIYDSVEAMELLVANDRHMIFQFVREGRYGLVSSQFGELLEPEFTDIFNIGTVDEPLFFADQHLDKTGFHVVSYIDQIGKFIVSKAYAREEFDEILCDD